MTARDTDGATTKIDAWWFASGDRLPHGDDRPIVIGGTHSLDGNIILCQNALHASRDPFQALEYAPGPYLYRVLCWGDVVEDGNKLGARHREYVAMHDATNMLRRFARQEALSVVHLWGPPVVVRQYLETGDETIRAAAWTAASAVAWDAPRDFAAVEAAAWAAARAVAWTAAVSAARAAAWAGAAAAAWAAAWAVAAAEARLVDWAAARNRFNELIAELFDGSRQP